MLVTADGELVQLAIGQTASTDGDNDAIQGGAQRREREGRFTNSLTAAVASNCEGLSNLSTNQV